MQQRFKPNYDILPYWADNSQEFERYAPFLLLGKDSGKDREVLRDELHNRYQKTYNHYRKITKPAEISEARYEPVAREKYLRLSPSVRRAYLLMAIHEDPAPTSMTDREYQAFIAGIPRDKPIRIAKGQYDELAFSISSGGDHPAKGNIMASKLQEVLNEDPNIVSRDFPQPVRNAGTLINPLRPGEIIKQEPPKIAKNRRLINFDDDEDDPLNLSNSKSHKISRPFQILDITETEGFNSEIVDIMAQNLIDAYNKNTVAILDPELRNLVITDEELQDFQLDNEDVAQNIKDLQEALGIQNRSNKITPELSTLGWTKNFEDEELADEGNQDITKTPKFWQRLFYARHSFSVIKEPAIRAFMDYLDTYARFDLERNSGQFISVISYFLASDTSPNSEDIKNALIWPDPSETLNLANFNWFNLFKFFAVMNNEIHDFPELGFLNTRDPNEWVTNVERLMISGLIKLPNSMLKHVRGNDILLRRLTVPQIELAITLTSEEISNHYPVTFEFVRNALVTGQAITGDIYFNVTEMWSYLFSLFILMRFMWSYTLALPDLLLRQRNYLKIKRFPILQQLRVIAAAPFLMTHLPSAFDIFSNPTVTNGFSKRSEYLYNIIQQFSLISKQQIQKFVVQAKIKKVALTSSEYQDRDDAEYLDIWFSVRINLFNWNVNPDSINYDEDMAEARELQESNLQNGFALRSPGFKILNDIIADILSGTPERFTDFLQRQVLNECLSKMDVYEPVTVHKNGSIDPNYFMVHDFNLLIKTPDLNKKLQNGDDFVKELKVAKHLFMRRVKPQSFSLLDTLVGYSEQLPICLFESFFHAYYPTEDLKTIKYLEEGVWNLKNRLRFKLYILNELPKDFRDACITGAFVEWYRYIKEHFPNIDIYDIEEIMPMQLYPDSRRYIITDSCHAVAVESAKLQLYSATLHVNHQHELDARRARTTTFICRKKPHYDENKDTTIEVFFDIETVLVDGKFVPYLVCLTSDSPGYSHAFWGVETCVRDFSQWIRDLATDGASRHKGAKQKIVIWSFNGFKFDLVFFLQHLAQLPGFQLKGEFTNPKWVAIGDILFIDFLRLMPLGSMVKQQEFWDTTLKKKDLDHSALTVDDLNNADSDQKRRIIDYCINDCLVLQEFTIKYKEFIKPLNVSPFQGSLASLVLDLFKTNYVANDYHTIKGCQYHQYARIKQSFFGGICEVYKLHFNAQLNCSEPSSFRIVETCEESLGFLESTAKEARNLTQEELKLPDDQQKKIRRVLQGIPDLTATEEGRKMLNGDCLYYYDVNSAYPHWMCEPMPIAPQSDWQTLNEPIQLNSNTHPSLLSDQRLYVCTGIKWSDDTMIPFFPQRVFGHLEYRKDLDHHVIWGFELKAGLETSKIIGGEVVAYLAFEYKAVFQPYIADFYERRKQCKANGDKVGTELYKRFMNNLYGKFGQKRYPEVHYVSSSMLDSFTERYKDEIWDIQRYGPDLYIITLAPHSSDTNTISYCVAVASYITAKQRVLVRKTQQKVLDMGGDCYYTDTDSIITSIKLPEELVDDYRLGAWKLESRIVFAIFLMPKAYLLIDSNNDYVIKFKGLRTENLTFQHFLDLASGMRCRINSGNIWIRNYDKESESSEGVGYVTIVPNNKTVVMRHKRKVDYSTGDTKPV